MAEQADKVELLSSGEVRLSFGGVPYTWRRPTMGEYRKLQETAFTASAIAEQGGDNPSEIANANIDGIINLFTTSHELLADKPFEGTEDDLPVWIFSQDFFLELFKHWQTVPTVAPGK